MRNYRSRISGPLLDRIDIVVEVPSVHFEDLRRRAEAEPSAAVKERVDKARSIQNERYGEDSGICNARMRPGQLRKYCELDEAGAALMKQAFDAMGLTARSYDRILKVARTIADIDYIASGGTCLEGIEAGGPICKKHVMEAVQMRSLDKYWKNN